MSNITADEYRTAAKVDRHHGGQSTAQFYEDNARALESVEAESFEFLNELALAFRAAENLPRPQYAPVLEGIRAVLAHLTSAGRLVPAGGHVLTAEEWANRITLADKQVAVSEAWEQGFEYGSDHIDAEVVGADVPDFAPGGVVIPEGGRVLTAEQVEDVEALVAAANPYSAPAARLRALFPATEPAEPAASEGVNCGANSVVLGWCTLSAQHEGLHTNGTYFWGQAPAPAEPAEEETKAEGPCMGGGDMHPCVLSAGHAGVHTDSRGLRWNNPVASPVVPAPTETGPWETWESVPDDVWFTSASAVGFLPAHRKRGSLVDWQFRDGSVGVYDVSRIGNGKLIARAPFVAAEEG